VYAIAKIWLLCHFAYVTRTRNIAYCKAFGEHLRNLRKKKGLTMMELAYEADIEYSQIAKIERGVSNTTISTVHLLAKALEIKPIELFRFNFPIE
jgi:transcriptional regulator with XRE-family HTH domain